MKKQYKVGIYCRLSVDDASNSAKAKNYIPGDESASIENQYEILSKFVMLNGWIEVKTYLDDGYSGGNFQRPGFLEMLEDARHGLINLILVKDLSRLGRDFVEVGRYTDVIFPSLGCRFVSVLDCLDSEGDNTDMLHFRSLMNDYHLKDLSGKIKSVLYAKKKSGQYLTAYAPYGYRKSDEDKHRLVVDEEAATVVREIYRMRCSGMAYGKIAAALNEKSILSPRWHWELHYGKKGGCKYSKLWTYATVKNILNDTVYLGIVTQNRTGSRSYKDKTMIQKPETEWICHEDAHEAIIDRKLWEAVQEKNRAVKQQAANRADPLPALFTGKLVCADCGHPLVANRETQRRKNGTVKQYVSYFCSHFATTGHSACSWHRIYEISLKTLVLNEIRAHSRAVAQDENAVLDKLRQQILSESAARQEDSKLEISRLRRRIGELEHMTAKLYEDKVSGVINGDKAVVHRGSKAHKNRPGGCLQLTIACMKCQRFLTDMSCQKSQGGVPVRRRPGYILIARNDLLRLCPLHIPGCLFPAETILEHQLLNNLAGVHPHAFENISSARNACIPSSLHTIVIDTFAVIAHSLKLALKITQYKLSVLFAQFQRVSHLVKAHSSSHKLLDIFKQVCQAPFFTAFVRQFFHNAAHTAHSFVCIFVFCHLIGKNCIVHAFWICTEEIVHNRSNRIFASILSVHINDMCLVLKRCRQFPNRTVNMVERQCTLEIVVFRDEDHIRFRKIFQSFARPCNIGVHHGTVVTRPLR